MRTETFNDVIDWTAQVHRELAAVLTEGALAQQDARARMLLDYLAEHESRLARTVEGFRHLQQSKALDTWCYDYNDQFPERQLQRHELNFASMNTPQINATLQALHGDLIHLYHYLVTRADSAQARDLLQDLVALEEHEAMTMAQSANRLEDL